jgi:hypothetical protein
MKFDEQFMLRIKNTFMTLSQVDVIMSQRGRYPLTAGQLESVSYHFKKS